MDEALLEKAMKGPRQVRWQRLMSPQVLGEVILLLVVAVFFAYFAWESRDWRFGAQLMPWIAIAIGIPLWLIRFVLLIRSSLGSGQYSGMRSEGGEAGRIMDLGFYLDDGSRAAARRLLRVSGSIVVLILAIWIVGWHIALPLYVFVYLLTAGQLNWWQAGIGGLMTYGFIWVLFDRVIGTFWHEPLLFSFLTGG